VAADIVLMAIKKKVTISWSGGKDSAFALYRILISGEYEVVSIHTLFNEENKRVGLHGVHETLIERQAIAMGLKLKKLYLPVTSNHDAYKILMTDFYKECSHQKIEAVVFGDIFLEDLRQFRETMLSDASLDGIFPLWKTDSKMMIDDFLNTGFKTVVCSADQKFFDERSVGKTIDQEFLSSLHPDVDPCGENGEFHTFVYEGPIFNKPVHFQFGDAVLKRYDFQVKNADGTIEEKSSAFWFRELI
jgi:uncharacterized protein (TIGR00290 family)